ncbi:MAG: ACP S-malonyltransferase, partial [Firmicutes bacterium]|nr:ACP S-malonyltransferase [Bacillota bacterium]
MTERIERMYAELKGEKIVQAANFNCPGQIVISGDALAVDKASVYLKEAGAKRIVPLKVSGPFHTALMKPAGDKLANEFKAVSFNEEKSKVVFNCLGREKTDDESMRLNADGVIHRPRAHSGRKVHEGRHHPVWRLDVPGLHQ